VKKEMKWALSGLGLILIISVLYSLAYLYSLTQVTVERIEVNSLQDVSMTGFTLGGNIFVRNDGIVDVSIRHIQYAVTLQATQQELANGIIPGDKVPAGSSVAFPMSTRINWVPTAVFAKQLFNGGNTKILIHGTVDVANLGITSITVPFEKEIDLGEYIRQFIMEEVKQVVQAVSETVKNAWNNGVDAVKAIFGS
jgi:anionic cell wall polymer biosynthesis LytR-Cps2A-Psr (LCP) family protein